MRFLNMWIDVTFEVEFIDVMWNFISAVIAKIIFKEIRYAARAIPLFPTFKAVSARRDMCWYPSVDVILHADTDSAT